MQLLNSKILSNDKNTRYSNKKAQDTRVTCVFCLLQLFRTTKMVEMRGFALQRLLPKVNRVQPKGFTLQSNGTAFAVQNPRIDDIEKQVEQEVQLVSRLVEMRGFEPRFVLLHPTPSTCLFGD